ncbi:hypothetical protein AVEN_6455-1 [Araneus ventricosus]|uniref:Uncharacterized protein n=1 Tax=Araneus ventricosus TaxID=182803 RepID=A0A4Y2SJI0_ARAVE|nr:hypothetical protein AVEN_6455-1 [Araneus ventricosus]
MDPKEDCLNFTITPSESIPTNRIVLADIAKLFDPLGFLGPVIVKAKVFPKKLWLQKHEWDQELSHQEKVKWETLRDYLNDLTNVRIQRSFGTVCCCSSFKAVSSLNLKIDKTCLYLDSTIVLAWINTLSHLLKVYRISRIHELTKDFSWYRVKTSENPADIISRGMTPQQLMAKSLWWNGPQFLQQGTVELSDENGIPTEDDYLHELKRESDKTLALTLDSTILDSLLSTAQLL